LIKDAWRARSWKDKLRIWFMPTGWRPEDVTEKYPLYKIEDVYHFEKYDPASSRLLYAWSWIQVTILLLLISWLFGNLASIGSPAMFVYGGFVFVYVYAFTELMNKNKYAVAWEFLKNIFGIGIIYYYGDWFGAGKDLPWINTVLIIYFITASLVAGWFVLYDFRKNNAGAVEIVTA
jgi:alkylglycerol monooxygenase